MAMTGGIRKTRRYFLQLAVKTICLIGIYAAYGVLQERMIKGHYDNVDGTSKDNFHPTLLLVFCNRLTSLATGLMLAQLQFAAERPTLLPSATSISPQPETWAQRISALVARIRPASPFLSYALVAGLNNAATVSQYASLSYLSFTTSNPGKECPDGPRLDNWAHVVSEAVQTSQWIGAAIVMLGIWGYLASFPKVPIINEEEQEKAIATNWIGVSCLSAYLFFDGLTSTMQERLFGQAKVREETFTLVCITGGIIDQMIWVNLFSSMIAFSILLLSYSESTTHYIKLALASPTLQLHILMLSVTSTAGLLVLFQVIATYGALIASLIMTTRQFVSIICNAAWFGNMTNIPLLSWGSIGFMAAGIWIKMDRRYDEITDEKNSSTEPSKSSERGLTFICQYLFPLVACPLTFVLLTATIEFACQPAKAHIDIIWRIY